ncbi:hypothetical protein ABZ023_10855 [Streptomyces sp. NPDC006367]|uniref:hypothetical protein n=1 Tax=unclassified Streptomyces TaxID=2593676 RepID=UPI0033BACA70
MHITVPGAVRSAVAVSLVALIAVGAPLGALAPEAGAAPATAAPALPIPLPGTGPVPLLTEGITVEGPLINNIALK